MTDPPTRRHKWPAATRELAYQVWAGSARQNVAETVRQLAGQLVEVPPETSVYRWAEDDGWQARASRELAIAAKLPGQLHVERLAVAGVEATEWLSALRSGRIPADTPGLDLRVKAAIHLEAAARSLLLAHAKSESRKPRSPKPEHQAVDVASLSADELEAYESRLRTEQRD